LTWRQLDKMTHKRPHKGTWWFPMAAELDKLGLNSQIIEYFDYFRFLKEGNDYLNKVFTDEVADYFISKSNLLDVKPYIKEFLKSSSLQVRPATIKDLDDYLAMGWLVLLDVNSRVLNGRPGYSGHVVLVYEKIGQKYMLHDPGLPAKK